MDLVLDQRQDLVSFIPFPLLLLHYLLPHDVILQVESQIPHLQQLPSQLGPNPLQCTLDNPHPSCYLLYTSKA